MVDAIALDCDNSHRMVLAENYMAMDFRVVTTDKARHPMADWGRDRTHCDGVLYLRPVSSPLEEISRSRASPNRTPTDNRRSPPKTDRPTSGWGKNGARSPRASQKKSPGECMGQKNCPRTNPTAILSMCAPFSYRDRVPPPAGVCGQLPPRLQRQIRARPSFIKTAK